MKKSIRLEDVSGKSPVEHLPNSGVQRYRYDNPPNIHEVT
jgi:hypothetical protein